MATLLHVCCGQCLLGPLDEVRRQGMACLFYNPNIHPLIEFRRRLKAVKIVAHREGLDLVADEVYGLRDFLERVDWRADERCRACYRMRLERTAREAADRGFDAFTTTLLVSTHQVHEAVREIGEQVADQVGVSFAYRDWRDLAGRGHDEARGRNLYRQQYCGCIFSEYDRYKDTGKHLWRPEGPSADKG